MCPLLDFITASILFKRLAFSFSKKSVEILSTPPKFSLKLQNLPGEKDNSLEWEEMRERERSL